MARFNELSKDQPLRQTTCFANASYQRLASGIANAAARPRFSLLLFLSNSAETVQEGGLS